jgi:hypothetical protein
MSDENKTVKEPTEPNAEELKQTGEEITAAQGELSTDDLAKVAGGVMQVAVGVTQFRPRVVQIVRNPFGEAANWERSGPDSSGVL